MLRTLDGRSGADQPPVAPWGSSQCRDGARRADPAPVRRSGPALCRERGSAARDPGPGHRLPPCCGDGDRASTSLARSQPL